jgi:hypothetical protein
MTTLYIKTHNKTGLKYFGKTIKEDVHQYRGSGKYWKRHIKVHGYDVTTEIYAQFEDNDPMIEIVGLKFSADNQITNSNDWANLKPETGRDGGGHKHSEETRRKISESNKGKNGYVGDKNPMFGKKHTDETISKIRDSKKGKTYSEDVKRNMKEGRDRVGRVHSEETKRKIGEKQIGRVKSEEEIEKMRSKLNGRTIPREVAEKIANTMRGQTRQPYKTIICPHCGKEGIISNMTRWHFDNCKLRHFNV